MIWLERPQAAFAPEQFLVLLPLPEMPLSDKLNAILRFSLVAGVALALIVDARMIGIPIAVALLTVIVYYSIPEEERFSSRCVGAECLEKPCTRPTRDNPFMNVTMDEYGTKPRRARACSLDKRAVAEDVRRFFDSTLARTDDDLFREGASDRQFYTTASTTIPNDQAAFVRYLYDGP
jgi:hypothetical protein